MRAIFKVGAVALVAAVLMVLYLMRFQGLRIERDGSGIWPMLWFYKPEQPMAAIEPNRATESVEQPGAERAPTPPASAPNEAKPAATARTTLAAAYWTDFRGPRRDGQYQEMPILTKWPPSGPPRLWRRPVGGGYASFVIANGNAFTIEQRRNQEVVAAYDMANGREVWSHAWDAFFQESMGGDGPSPNTVH